MATVIIRNYNKKNSEAQEHRSASEVVDRASAEGEVRSVCTSLVKPNHAPQAKAYPTLGTGLVIYMNITHCYNEFDTSYSSRYIYVRLITTYTQEGEDVSQTSTKEIFGTKIFSIRTYVH